MREVRKEEVRGGAKETIANPFIPENASQSPSWIPSETHCVNLLHKCTHLTKGCSLWS